MLEFSAIRYYLFGLILNIKTLLLISMVAGIILYLSGRKSKATKCLLFSAITFVFVAASPLQRELLYQLEYRFQPIKDLPENAAGLILLGGFYSLHESQAEERPIFNLAAGRLIEFVSLARRYPNLPIIFTGSFIEGQLTKKLFLELGIDPSRITIEAESKNTYENIVNTGKLIHAKEGQKWVVVTSAFHMPRTIGLFRKVGCDVIPYPVDYHTIPCGLLKRMLLGLDHHNFVIWWVVMKEWAGLVNNYLNGYSKEIFPG